MNGRLRSKGGKNFKKNKIIFFSPESLPPPELTIVNKFFVRQVNYPVLVNLSLFTPVFFDFFYGNFSICFGYFDSVSLGKMFSAIHALERALKAALLTKIADGLKTHTIGGQFGEHFRNEVGSEMCHRISVNLS